MSLRLRHGVHLILAFLIGLSASYAGVTLAAEAPAPVAQVTRTPITVALRPGDRLSVSCVGRLAGSLNLIQCLETATATASATPTRQATLTRTTRPTRTVRPSRTPTRPAAASPTPTRTVTRPAASPTRTAAPPTATRTSTVAAPTSSPVPSATPTHDHGAVTPTTPPSGAIYDSAPIAPEILGTCSQQVHDRYAAQGPDGVWYRTWHPQVVDNGAGGTCTFAHEHGTDPATSHLAGAEPIWFDYVAHIAEIGGMPMPEAHEGFKVHVVNAGQVNDEGRVSRVTALMLYHMGTGGVRRYLAPMHTLAVQAEMPDGSRVNIRGMAETGSAGSICARDRREVVIGRTVMTLPGVPESANGGQPCALTSPYEIWEFSLAISRNLGGEDPLLIFNSSLAAFDPVTTMDPADPTRLVYSSDAFPEWNGGYYRGCNREFYVGSVALRNAVATQVWTDAHGNVLSGAHTPADALLQVMPIGNVFDTRSPASSWNVLAAWSNGSGALNQMKLQQPTCGGGLGLKN